MGNGVVRAALALGVGLLALFAWGPLLSAPFAGSDYQTLVEVRELALGGAAQGPPSKLHGIEGTRGHPLPALSLAFSDRLWTREGWDPAARTALRLENLLLLFAGAGLFGLFLRRLLMPWTGHAQAAAAGWAASLLVTLHPLQARVIASPGARGDLLALALCSGAGLLLLCSRQEREPRLAVVAGVLAILGGFSAGLALALPAVLFLAELTSARRYRPAHVRLRTAATTFLVFGACVGVDVLVRSLSLRSFDLGADPFGPAVVANAAELQQALAVSVERLGVLLLPVNSAASGAFGFVLAALLVLLAAQPAMLAARSAPRLWGWMLAAWLGVLVNFELLQPSGRVGTDDLSLAAALFPGVAAVCGGLAVAATSVSGTRRAALPLLIALGFSLLGHGHATAERDAGWTAEHLRRDLESARETYGLDVHLLVVDPPRIVRGVSAIDGALPWMLQPPFARAGAATYVRALSAEALRAFFREEELEQLREDPLVVVLPQALLEGAGGEPGRRLAVRVPPPQPTAGKLSWFREGRVSDLDLEGATARVLRVRAAEGVDTSRPPRVRWRATAAWAQEGEHQGVWVASGETPTALFDLSASIPWLLGERITQLWPVEGWTLIRSAEIREALPAPGDWLAPRISGADWVFDAPEEPDEGVVREGAESWALGLLDLATLEHVELPMGRSGDLLRAARAEAVAQRLLRSGGPLAWTLEQRLDGVAVARARGRH